MSKNKHEILIVSTGSENVTYDDRKKLVSDLAGMLFDASELAVDVAMLEDLLFVIANNEPQVIFEGEDIARYSVIFVKSWFGSDHTAKALAEYATIKGIKLVCSEVASLPSKEKLSEAFMLAAGRLPHPDLLFSTNGQVLVRAVKEQRGITYPLIVKSITGYKGKDNYLVSSESELEKLIPTSRKNLFMVQQFIPNNGDYRLLTMGDSVPFILHRQGDSATTHLNNTSQGGAAKLIDEAELPVEFIEYAKKASRTLGREIAGVDLIVSSLDQKPYVLEVNASPQLQTGAFVKQKNTALAEYLRTLASQPAKLSSKKLETIGVTAKIDFIGYRNLKSIAARIDTGARTSSLWASDVHVKGNLATFKLFGKGSPYFTGKVVRKPIKETRNVTSSTGHEQERYVVQMPILMMGKRINAKFTLSDRSSQTYPILIGRNTLRGNFLVDSANPGEVKLYKYPEEEKEFNVNEAAV